MLTRSFVRLAVVLLAGVSAAVAQWTPVTARIRETTETLLGKLSSGPLALSFWLLAASHGFPKSSS